MEMRIRSWCCQLSTLVTVVVIIETVVCLVMATLAVSWAVLAYTVDSYPWLAQHHPRQAVITLIICLTVSFSGILCSCLLLVGIRTQSRYLLVPWLVFSVTGVLTLLVSGTYCIVLFTIIKKEKDYMMAAVSSSLVLLGILMIFIIVLVVHLFIEMKQKQLLVRVASSFRGSRASVNYKYQGNKDKPMSIRSNSSVPPSNGHRMRHHSDQHRNSQKYRVDKFSCTLKFPAQKTRSLEHILDSSPGNSGLDNSSYQQQITKSLPRIRPTKDYKFLNQPGYPSSSSHMDTIRSSKSVSIYPRVTEYHYANIIEGDDTKGIGKEESDDKKKFRQIDDEGKIPAPIFPIEKVASKEQIIEYACGEGEFIL
jgi:hypothetical protein